MENINNDSELRKIFARRLKKLRVEKEMTLQELADALSAKYGVSVSFSSIGNYERAYRIPDLFLLSKIAEYFDCTTDYLLGATDMKNAKVIQTTIFDKENNSHNVKIGVDKDSDLANMSLKEIREFVLKLKELGIDVEKINK